MKTSTRIVLANLALIVALLFIYPEFMISPGELKKGHREFATDCFACHTVLRGATSTQCIECHKVADIGLVTTKGKPIKTGTIKSSFHQNLLEQDCVACHSDHQGVETYRTMRRFSHALIEPRMVKQCDSCHRNPADALHKQVSGKCDTCHTSDRWVPATFDHDKYFRFDRYHETKCATCHKGNDFSRYTCYGCHEHSEWGVRREHVEEGIRDFENCVECHRSGDEDEAKWRMRTGAAGRGVLRAPRGEHHDDD